MWDICGVAKRIFLFRPSRSSSEMAGDFIAELLYVDKKQKLLLYRLIWEAHIRMHIQQFLPFPLDSWTVRPLYKKRTFILYMASFSVNTG
jgi:hypothetical protein